MPSAVSGRIVKQSASRIERAVEVVHQHDGHRNVRMMLTK